MNRTKTFRTIIVMAALMIGAALIFAHNGIEHVMGTVTALTDLSVTVETVGHKSVTVMVDSSATFTNKNTKASFKDLKIGDRVVINAKESSDKKLQAVSLKWGASASNKMPADHKM